MERNAECMATDPGASSAARSTGTSWSRIPWRPILGDAATFVVAAALFFSGVLALGMVLGIPLSPGAKALHHGYWQLKDGRRLVFHSREEMKEIRASLAQDEIDTLVLGQRDVLGLFPVVALGSFPFGLLVTSILRGRKELLGLLRPSGWALAWGVAGFGVMAPVGMLGSRLVPKGTAMLSTMQSTHWSIVVPFVVILAPLAEEFWFRGRLFGLLDHAMGRPWAITGTAVLFALLHVGGGLDYLPLVGAYFVTGVVLAWLRVRTRGLVAPIVAHALTNATAVFLLYWTRPY